MAWSGATRLAVQYFHVLADVVKFSPNLQHLSVVSLETDEVSFWNHILPNDSGPRPSSHSTEIAVHGFPTLKSLCVQIHTHEFCFDNHELQLFRRVCSAMTGVPALIDLRASSVIECATNVHPHHSKFERLQRLEITECVLELDNIVQLLDACNGLRHISCDWAWLDTEDPPSLLYDGLLRHSKTLETLYLDLRDISYFSDHVERLGSLRPFTNLRSLALCQTTLFGSTVSILDIPDQVRDFHLSDHLPSLLQKLTLLISGGLSLQNDTRLDASSVVWTFIDDFMYYLSDLREVQVKSCHELSAPEVSKAFVSAGVRFSIVEERSGTASVDDFLH
ncbi:hypothetical protein GQ44DRAFT_707074 [Phaeosphaeriaceae sp. PMI808]|nr:hypothetical protein GQ44DRAFT_707074 [Phaeosphaeriaceae sp. PMI808]